MTNFEAVGQFMKTFGQEIKTKPEMADADTSHLRLELISEELNELYNHPKVKAMVSTTKGEGFGRPLLEFSLTGKPIMASGWSGHLDFLHKGLVNIDVW